MSQAAGGVLSLEDEVALLVLAALVAWATSAFARFARRYAPPRPHASNELRLRDVLRPPRRRSIGLGMGVGGHGTCRSKPRFEALSTGGDCSDEDDEASGVGRTGQDTLLCGQIPIV